MARGPEARRQDQVARMFRAHGWLVTKISAGGGWTDLVMVSPTGFVLFAEMKAPDGTLRPLQEHFMKEINSRAARGNRTNIAHVVWDSRSAAADWLFKHNRYEVAA